MKKNLLVSTVVGMLALSTLPGCSFLGGKNPVVSVPLLIPNGSAGELDNVEITTTFGSAKIGHMYWTGTNGYQVNPGGQYTNTVIQVPNNSTLRIR